MNPSRCPAARTWTASLQRVALALVLGAVSMSGMTAMAGTASISAPAVDLTPVPARHSPSTLSSDWRHGAFMQVFVRSYQDSDGDGHGDLRGLISRLDDLQALGITGLWLLPVMPSQDQDHGYAVKDYRAIEPAYGTLADFDELLRQAHARGIGVIIDYVINHSAAEHPLFIASDTTGASPWRDWYVWRDTVPEGWKIYGQNPWYETDHGAYFAGFWNQMPDFNLRNPAVVAWHHDNLRWWLNRGVDGFRFDAVGNLVENGPDRWENQPENDALLDGVRRVVMGYPNRYLVCESPGAPLRYASAHTCGASFAFTQNFNVVGAAAGDDASLADAAAYFSTAPATMATMASNHDSFAGDRLWNQLDGDLAQIRQAAASYLLLPGTPFIYYGEEVGMANAATLTGDPKLRSPMSWTGDPLRGGFTTGEPYRALAANVTRQNAAAQRGDPASLRGFYRDVIALRRSSPALMRGAYAQPRVDGLVFSFQRVLGERRALVVFNHARRAANARVEGLPANSTLTNRWPAGDGALRTDAQGAAWLQLPAQSFRVFESVP
ncbi:alpha-amylase family glycosyl hydrolase [Sphaerotilus mobilis]|uniref:Glycosidase n=1 Tax=Sphaerotilus mobilis TaxID=47994 RepID=A0A4Q7LKM1_9BURK|nr:alpha-amylase family glycosyl hydrolase [Sphaerotilus mobilis]RZS54721.1 glycosidase [Sphaerotilus mobilis]